MSVYFLSDLHLPPGASAASARFVGLLAQAKAGDTWVLGGDIFDLFVGHKRVFLAAYAEPLAAIRAGLGRGARFFFLEGNHDFHLAAAFRGELGIEICAEDISLDCGGRSIWVSHGDQIDPTDRGYRLLRWFSRSWLGQFLVCLLPGSALLKLGQASARQSRKYNSAERMSEVEQARVRGLYWDFAKAKVAEGFQHVLVGHSHLPDQLPITAGERRGEYLNLGFSAVELLYARLEPGQEKFTKLSWS